MPSSEFFEFLDLFTPGDEYNTFDVMFSIEVFEEDGKY